MFADPEYLESLFKQWQKEPSLLDESWSIFFSRLPLLEESSQTTSDSCHYTPLIEESLKALFREKGYLIANLPHVEPDPWWLERKTHFDGELAKLESLAGRSLEASALPWRALYSSRIGLQPPDDPREAQWLYRQIEESPLEKEIFEETSIWQLLVKTTRFEKFLHKQFVGQKRFSLEGEETLIAMIESLIKQMAQAGGSHVVLGSTHRGRLNLMAHCVGKPYEVIFKEFADKSFEPYEMGDVKYHKGYACLRSLDEQKVFVELLSNPSHMESIGPVLMGVARGAQRGKSGEHLLPILLHGDGSFAGQGVVYEALQLSGIDGYDCKGVLHVVINNQVVFTATPKETRSTFFCTDIARTFGYPVFHVSAYDPHACLYAAKLAFQYRKRYGRDAVIDLIGYRRHGHNESDEPRYTQPHQYEKIDQAPDIALSYCQEIRVDPQTLKTYEEEIDQRLWESFERVKAKSEEKSSPALCELPMHHSQTIAHQLFDKMQLTHTAIDSSSLKDLVQGIYGLQEGVQIHKKLQVLYEEKREHLLQGGDFDWASAELLAYGSLLKDGHGVRLSGEDVVRGTFSHRHIGLFDKTREDYYFPLKALELAEGTLEVLNSPLSEFGVLGFEYGYSLACVNDLVIWEAQFGDFSNEAQVIIDQYLSSAYSKWAVESRLTLFLPHGYEGQGPEHSSARMERFLSLSTHGNWCLANPTTPAQLFHLLRRQVLQPAVRPLVIFTPKSLLRHPKCRSPQSALSDDRFHEMLLDPSEKATKTLVMTSGKLYYEVRDQVSKASEVAILRLEQLYPFSLESWLSIIEGMESLERVIWIQEEPINMGAALWIRQHLRPVCDERHIEWSMIAREQSNSVATGHHERHLYEQEKLLEELQEHLGHREELPGFSSTSVSKPS